MFLFDGLEFLGYFLVTFIILNLLIENIYKYIK